MRWQLTVKLKSVYFPNGLNVKNPFVNYQKQTQFFGKKNKPISQKHLKRFKKE